MALNYVALRETWSHMSEVSGFDLFPATLERIFAPHFQSVFVDPATVAKGSLLQRAKGKFLRSKSDRLRHLPPSPTPFSQHRHEAAADRALQLVRQNSKSMLLLTVADNQFGRVIAGVPQEIRSRVIACFHQPPAWMRLNWRDFRLLNGLNKIVTLSDQQRRFFESVTSTRITTIRHGVQLNFFVPIEKNLGDKRLLFVGQWLRDLDLLNAAMTKIWSVDSRIQLDCVIPMHARQHTSLLKLARSDRVRWHACITSDELRMLYQHASLLFLPLVDATANNAIVEAMACGLPIVSTRVGGIPDYVPESCGELCELDSVDSHADAVLRWVSDPARLSQAGNSCRQWAEENLNWESISREFLADN